ncbi:MAG: L,D-transpeptidase family protein [Candidatus Cyclobacteriaceae bacterium M2_1C_046]
MFRILFVIILFCLSFHSYAQLSEEIRIRIELIDKYPNPQIENIPIIAKNSIKEFYNNRLFEPAWENRNLVDELLLEISKANENGLNPDDYFFKEIQQLQRTINREGTSPDLDILLTQSFLMYANHLVHGKVDPVSLDPYWKIKKKEKNIVEVLSKALQENTIQATLRNLNPDFKTYIRLKDYLRHHQQSAEKVTEWIKISTGPVIKADLQDERIPLIRERVVILGDLQVREITKDSIYDRDLERAVKKFQARHGLKADGAIGERTITALNIPIEERIQKVIINMERCRWLPEDLGQNYILVNIANFNLRYVKNKELIKEMDVVVGKRYRQTPVFSSIMTYLVLNPYWFVPPTILREDMIPAVRKDPKYLDKMNIKVVKGAFGEVVPSSSIDWKEVKASAFPYTLRQEPGPNNALGVVKFMFPNEFNVYLHDTNKKELFQQEDRDLSSGCIRVSEPLELAHLILKGQGDWSMDKIKNSIALQKNFTVRINDPVTVHLEYWTCFADTAGIINFRKDIYDRDQKVWQALKGRAKSI